ncbi:MAG: glycerol-3-phosphate 1-O-acyltransferase PlsY [Candidatus Omnitrophica bacterium]|nr:glycerol-3-phosphate 1-O-acyltransferase PlsY [Candidatus Omnitrophota bacterium]
MNTAIFIILAYFLGSIPFGLIIGRLVRGIDVRQHGSGNVGATNVFRVVGKKWGILVLFLDALKGYAAVAVPVWTNAQVAPPVLMLTGIVAILGHSFSIWLKLKGGKGVATSLGVFLGLAAYPTLLAFAVFILVFMVSRIISISSLSAAIVFPIILFYVYRFEALFIWLFPVSILLAVFIFYTHRANILRLMKGEEKKLF